MVTNGIKNSIKKVYGELWEIIALYEPTQCYNVVPEGSDKSDIWEYMGDKLLRVRKTINELFLGQEDLREALMEIVDETEYFVRRYEKPGVVKRWLKINPKLLFFDCVFDIMENEPEMYREICRGFTEIKFSCYPDAALIQARKEYLEESKRMNDNNNFRYSEDRVFQNELHRTLTLVFENDFEDYL